VELQPYQGDLFYFIHTLFIRDVGQILAGQQYIDVGGWVTGVSGVLTDHQYWLVEIPALTREVLLNIDEIVIVRRQKPWKPKDEMRSKVARGEMWSLGKFIEHPIYALRKGYDDGKKD
jgi:hypothetical protein